MEVSHGRAYAHPEKDGASTWMATGPAYVPGAPRIDNPGVLPMAPDEPGETLLVSGTVRSTSGKPLPGAVIDLWQTTADGRHSGLTPEQAGPLEGPLVQRRSVYSLVVSVVVPGTGGIEPFKSPKETRRQGLRQPSSSSPGNMRTRSSSRH
ncbi:hypothetical protein ACFZC6_34470 [Streptomyces ossamyceticus]|jgi:hypothetical protein|uniref:dioxygenase family protein n=1 Tax=Streptomyces ossamyceticus TaxID=249581 RepID=UPI0036E0624E